MPESFLNEQLNNIKESFNGFKSAFENFLEDAKERARPHQRLILQSRLTRYWLRNHLGNKTSVPDYSRLQDLSNPED